jgi:hypothetical protein
MWNMLNTMAEENPLEYDNFIAQQLEKTKEPETNENHKFFRPTSGFCIKTITTDGDGVKIRDASSPNGKSFYINFCSHEAVEPPKDKFGRPVLDEVTSADGLEIPMAIGATRNTIDNSLAVDVVYHPVVLLRCQHSNFFRTQIIDLALEWIKTETNIKYSTKYELMNKSYYGGRGEDESTPVMFIVDADGHPVKCDSTNQSTPIANPSNLLNTLKEYRNDTSSTSSDINVNLSVSNNVPFASQVKCSIYCNHI